MTDVDVAAEVAALLDPATLADVFSTPAHQSITFSMCGQRMPVGAGEPLSAILRPGPEGREPDLVLQFAHRRCAPSGIPRARRRRSSAEACRRRASASR